MDWCSGRSLGSQIWENIMKSVLQCLKFTSNFGSILNFKNDQIVNYTINQYVITLFIGCLKNGLCYCFAYLEQAPLNDIHLNTHSIDEFVFSVLALADLKAYETSPLNFSPNSELKKRLKR